MQPDTINPRGCSRQTKDQLIVAAMLLRTDSLQRGVVQSEPARGTILIVYHYNPCEVATLQ